MTNTATLQVLLFCLLSASAGPAIGGAPIPPRSLAADTLAAPPILVNESKAARTVEVTLTAMRTRMELVPGVQTEVYAYNGHIPGPTLEVHEGDRVIIHLRNELPEETTVHWHGLHIEWQNDGSPFHPVPPGGEARLEFTIPVGTAGTYWYHPHAMHRTQSQVPKGLAGAIIVRAADDPLAGVPEKLLILGDNRLAPDGSIDLPEPTSPAGRIDFENGREGNLLFVNGQIMPEIRIRPGEVQRWRVVNASAARLYRLAIPGVEMLYIGGDGGLFDRPVPVEDIKIAASERIELLVRGANPGRTVLRDLPYDRYIPQTRPRDWNQPRDLVSVDVTGERVARAFAVPALLRHVEPIDTALVTNRRVFSLTQGFINNKAMDMARIDERGTLGTTEIWTIENLVGMDHPFHLHGFRFQVLDRNGVPEPFLSWEDTVNVPEHESVRIIVQLDDFAGKWMYHCHILDHEENGMMGVLEIR